MAEQGSDFVHQARARRCPSCQFISERRNGIAILRRALLAMHACALQALAKVKPDFFVRGAGASAVTHSLALLTAADERSPYCEHRVRAVGLAGGVPE